MEIICQVLFWERKAAKGFDGGGRGNSSNGVQGKFMLSLYSFFKIKPSTVKIEL